eukprot:GHVU01154433.1.p2 GENE.GHVU01154433.1~~GHVU01154433.1.p2  ORF type:complete len:122 (-),score=11.16 GHVU01154433.1:113-478(-)
MEKVSERIRERVGGFEATSEAVGVAACVPSFHSTVRPTVAVSRSSATPPLNAFNACGCLSRAVCLCSVLERPRRAAAAAAAAANCSCFWLPCPAAAVGRRSRVVVPPPPAATRVAIDDVTL